MKKSNLEFRNEYCKNAYEQGPSYPSVKALEEAFDAGLAFERKRSAALVELLLEIKDDIELKSKDENRTVIDFLYLKEINSKLKQYEAEGES